MPGTTKLSSSSEDYLEAIYLICKKNGEARSKDICKFLGVSGPSVTEALQLLKTKGMVNYEPYAPITLTEKGEQAGCDVFYRHETLKDFLIEVLGIEKEQAEVGACIMEHAVTPKIIERMVKYTRYLRQECYDNSSDKSCSFDRYLSSID